MHTGNGYEARKSPHSSSTNDLKEVNECGKLMGDGKKCTEEDYKMKHDSPASKSTKK